MKNCLKKKLSVMIYGRPKLNRRLVCIKNSFDDVCRLVNGNKKCK